MPKNGWNMEKNIQPTTLLIENLNIWVCGFGALLYFDFSFREVGSEIQAKHKEDMLHYHIP